ncbi:MAG: alpha/beta hydrolase, partial [Candidatus Cybelea sp.]
MGGRPRFSGALAGVFLAAAVAYANAPQIARASAPQVASGLDYAGDGSDAHRLDLYLPQDPHSTAIVIFIHGGAFMQGTRQGYAEVGRAFALQGIPTAVVSYRLYPQSDAGGACRDVALATMWMIRHAGAYGLEAHNVFLVGHSAG